MRQLLTDNIFANQYRLIRRIGKGGFSEVWKVLDQNGDAYALKVIAPETTLPDSTIAMLGSEYELTFALNHGNLVKPLLYDIWEGTPYLLLPLCEKGSLADKINERLQVLRKGDFLHPKPFERCPFTEEEIGFIIKDIASALHYLHNKNVLHNDIKPANILISETDKYFLTDFGISTRARMTAKRITRPNLPSDSPDGLTIAYTAPEIFSSNPHASQASDIFSLGVMIYELATGNVPWLGQGGLMLKNGAEIPDLPVFYSKRFRQLIKACLSKYAEDRPSAQELEEVSKHFIANGFWSELTVKTNEVNIEPEKSSLNEKQLPKIKKRFNWKAFTGISLFILLTFSLIFIRFYARKAAPIGFKLAISAVNQEKNVIIDSAYFSDSQSLIYLKVPAASSQKMAQKLNLLTLKDGQLNFFSLKVQKIESNEGRDFTIFTMIFPALPYPTKSVHLIEDNLENWDGCHFFKIPVDADTASIELDLKVKAWLLAKGGNLNLALLDIAKKINTDPEDDQALHIRAILALKNKDYYAATKNLAVAIERAQHKENKKLAEENVAYHRIFLAKILNIQHQYQAAIDETDLALKTTKDADAYFQRGLAFSQQNKFVLALSDFKSAFKLRQKPIFQYEIAHAHYRLEKFDEADSILTAMVLENTNLSEVYFLRGKIAIFQNKFEAAVTDMNKTLDFAPDQVFALYFRAFAFEKLGKNAEKCADIQKIKEIANAEIMADDNFIMMAKKCK